MQCYVHGRMLAHSLKHTNPKETQSVHMESSKRTNKQNGVRNVQRGIRQDKYRERERAREREREKKCVIKSDREIKTNNIVANNVVLSLGIVFFSRSYAKLLPNGMRRMPHMIHTGVKLSDGTALIYILLVLLTLAHKPHSHIHFVLLCINDKCICKNSQNAIAS